MYAVIKTGGKQYKVIAGETLKVEKLAGEVGSKVVIDKVLMLADGDAVTIGSPLIAGAVVNATVVSHGRGDKVTIFKFQRRKHYRKTQGHRQSYTEIQIDDVNGKGSTKVAAKPKATAKPKAAAKPAAKAKATGTKDKLTIIEGVGPKIAELLNADGIMTFADLAKAKVKKLTDILEAAGSRYTMHKPDTWPEQAALARDGKMDELKALQDALDGGKAK
jgi:large subunit ribosomal protein L21